MDKPKGFDSGYDKYLEYLNSDQWRVIRTNRLLKDNFRCAVCGSPNQLHVHHLFYPAEYGTESLDDVITLCPVCHGLVEKLKKEGTHRSKWQKYDFYMTATVYVSKQDMADFIRRKQIPSGNIAIYNDAPNSNDFALVGRTNLYGIRLLQEAFENDVEIKIGGN